MTEPLAPFANDYRPDVYNWKRALERTGLPLVPCSPGNRPDALFPLIEAPGLCRQLQTVCVSFPGRSCRGRHNANVGIIVRMQACRLCWDCCHRKSA